jgi:hypothetical protein
VLPASPHKRLADARCRAQVDAQLPAFATLVGEAEVAHINIIHQRC